MKNSNLKSWHRFWPLKPFSFGSSNILGRLVRDSQNIYNFRPQYLEIFKTKSVVFNEISLKMDVSYKDTHFICVIGSQIHFEVTKILWIWIKNFVNRSANPAQHSPPVNLKWLPLLLSVINTQWLNLGLNCRHATSPAPGTWVDIELFLVKQREHGKINTQLNTVS